MTNTVHDDDEEWLIELGEALVFGGLPRPTEMRLEAQKRLERIASRLALVPAPEASLGVGDGSGQLFVHGSYDAIKRVQQMIFELERLSPSTEEGVLRSALTEAEQFLDKANALALGKYQGSVQVLADRLAEVRDQSRAALAGKSGEGLTEDPAEEPTG